jgi:hypothetical protein
VETTDWRRPPIQPGSQFSSFFPLGPEHLILRFE